MITKQWLEAILSADGVMADDGREMCFIIDECLVDRLVTNGELVNYLSSHDIVLSHVKDVRIKDDLFMSVWSVATGNASKPSYDVQFFGMDFWDSSYEGHYLSLSSLREVEEYDVVVKMWKDKDVS